jgi:hypothetical protein
MKISNTRIQGLKQEVSIRLYYSSAWELCFWLLVFLWEKGIDDPSLAVELRLDDALSVSLRSSGLISRVSLREHED